MRTYIIFHRKRFLKTTIIYTLVCSLIGFAIGTTITRLTLDVEATTDKVIETRHIVDEPKIAPPVKKTIPLGMCMLTAYCKENYPHICNNGDSTYTATGTVPTVGRTVAVDPSVIPYGSEVIINEHTYIAEDCGGAVKGNRIDILFETHKEALQFGVQYAEVHVVK